MKKFWKVLLISLGSLLLLVIIVVGVALWLVFTPARLTPIVNKQAAKFVTCGVDIDRVELTLFSSFPELGLKMDGVRLVNPISGTPNDTLLRLDRLKAVIDIKALLKRDELILSDIVLNNGTICLYTDTHGGVNYDILKPDSDPKQPDDEEDGFTISRIDADNVTLQNIDIVYVDDASLMNADVKGLFSTIKASMNEDVIGIEVTSTPFDVAFSMGRADSLITVGVSGLSLNVNGSKSGNLTDGYLNIAPASVTLAYGAEEYLKEARLELTANISAHIADQSVNIKDGTIKINGLEIKLDGGVKNDSVRGIDMDIRYKLCECALESVLALVPESFKSYLDGVEASGSLSAEGTAVGVYGKDTMPMVDMSLVLNGGRVSYPELLPYPLTAISADLDIHTNLEDGESFVKVNQLRARALSSSIRASGTLNRLFSDPHANLIADLDASLADVEQFLPDSLNATLSGKLSGRLRADLRMSQIERMELEKMKVSGSLLVSNLDAAYDTITVVSPSAKIDFSLPNSKPTSRHATFAAVSIASDDLAVKMGATGNASLGGVKLAVETSDIRDETYSPAVDCSFSMATLSAGMDDMSLAVERLAGKASFESVRRNGGIANIKVIYTNDGINAGAGIEKLSAGKVDLNADILYDKSKEDIWQMFTPHCYIDVRDATAHVSMLNYPVELQTLKMGFTPRKFNIDEARIKLDKSDFSLEGYVDNILPYFMGDSILRGELNFNSPVADIAQLLALTNGIGAGEEMNPDVALDEFNGPYMVPEGIDMTLHAKIERALWYGKDISKVKEFSRIRGDITVRDGVVFMTPELTFSSPATDGDITLEYRTPRKNHLYAGTILHLTQIDIEELVDLIPDLDSIMPMLRSFEGNAEFHFAVEAYFDSTYRFKMSTIRGVCSISATDLVLKDEQLFRTVAKFMKYKDEGVIRVDSLSADFTIFRDAVTVYPFLFSVDRYKAVVSGKHNLDMSFDYNVSLVQSPIPFRVAVTVKGHPDDLKFKLSKSSYPDFYRPQRSDAYQTREMEMRKQIRGALVGTMSKKDEE